jgi:hypothetical protein
VPRVQVVLLDHIPHWDAAGPTPYVQSTYVPYKMSVFIPDIACKQVGEKGGAPGGGICRRDRYMWLGGWYSPC